jgi:hypothetical protein
MKKSGTVRKAGGVAIVSAMLVLSFADGNSLSVSAQGASAPGQVKAKRYKATRAFVVDKQSGDVRMPTQQEVDEIVANLSALGQRPAESLPQTTEANGTVSMSLDGGFNGVLLGRPAADGAWETRCVFTVEEGAEFLGLVEDESVR